MYFVRPIPTATSLLALLLLTSCASNSAIEQSRAFERRGEWQRAFEVVHDEYEARAEQGAVGEELEQAHERLLNEAMRDRAQSLIFHEQEEKACRC